MKKVIYFIFISMLPLGTPVTYADRDHCDGLHGPQKVDCKCQHKYGYNQQDYQHCIHRKTMKDMHNNPHHYGNPYGPPPQQHYQQPYQQPYQGYPQQQPYPHGYGY